MGGDNIYLFGGVGPTSDTQRIKCFNRDKGTFSILKQRHLEAKERFFFNNYSVVNKGKTIIALGTE